MAFAPAHADDATHPVATSGGTSSGEYQAIAEMILSGDAKRAERTAALHIRRTRLSLMKLPDEAFPTIRK
jgi:DNA-binding GntR family transcriptional regulator